MTALLISLMGLLTAPLAAQQLYHVPPDTLFQGIPYQLEVITPLEWPSPAMLRLYLRSDPKASFQEIPFEGGPYRYTVWLDMGMLATKQVEYAIVAIYPRLGQLGYPPRDPLKHPQIVPVSNRHWPKWEHLPWYQARKRFLRFELTAWKRQTLRSKRSEPVFNPGKTQKVLILGRLVAETPPDCSLPEIMGLLSAACKHYGWDGLTNLKFAPLHREDYQSPGARLTLTSIEGEYFIFRGE